VDDTETAIGEDKDLTRFKSLFKEDYDARIEWAKEAVIDYAMHAGHGQWEEADRIRLKDQQRPCITFNRIAPVVASVVGQEINQRAEVTYKPRTTQTAEQPAPGGPNHGMAPMGVAGPNPGVPGADDTGPAETITAAAAYLRDQCDAEDEESDAFQDTVICGMGWVETRVSHDENPDGELVEDRIDPLNMYWDCKAEKRNLVDARRVWYVKEIDKWEAKELFPGKDMSALDASWARMDKTTQPHDREAARHYASDNVEDYDPNRKTVTLVECQYYVTKTAYKSVKLDETTRQLTEESVEFDDKKLADNYAKNVFTVTGQQAPVSKHKKRVYRTAIIGKEVLSDEESQSQECFKYQAITGYRDRNLKQWVGLVRAMRDPQRWANALFSSVLHQIQTTGKGIMAEEGAFADWQKAEKDWANGAKIVKLNTGAVAGKMIQQKEQHAIPAGMFDMMQLSLGAFRDVTGVNIESMGLADRSQAASLEMQRTRQAGVILAGLFDGKRRFTKDNGRLTLDLIRNFLSDGRLVRIVGPDYEKYVPLVKDDDTIEYDIIVDESPSSPNNKDKTWDILQQLFPVIGPLLGPSSGTALLKATPLPLSTVNEFKKAVEAERAAAAQQPNPEQQKLEGEMQIKQMDAQIKQQQSQQDAALTQQKGAIDLHLGQLNVQLKTIEVELAKFQAGIDLQKAQFDVQAKTQEMGFKQQEMGFKQKEAEHKSQEGEKQRSHDQQMRRMEIDGNMNAEMMKNPEAMGSMTAGLSKGLEAVATAMADGLKAMAEGQQSVAQALLTPKVAQLSADGTSATVRAQ
jgi:hypothetical protein